MTVNVYDFASAEILENECRQANPAEWITQDHNKGTRIENTARQFPFVFCTAHRWNIVWRSHSPILVCGDPNQ